MTNKQAAIDVCVGAGAASQYAERISSIGRGPPTLTRTDRGAIRPVHLYRSPKARCPELQESSHLQFHNKSYQLPVGESEE